MRRVMLSRTIVVALLAAALAAGFARGGLAQYKEPLFLAHSVAMGDLPPVEKRLPATPAVAAPRIRRSCS